MGWPFHIQESKRLDELEKDDNVYSPTNQKLERARRTSQGESEPPNISVVTTAITPSKHSCPAGAKARWFPSSLLIKEGETPLTLSLSHSIHSVIYPLITEQVPIMGPLWCWMLRMLRWINHRHSLPVTPHQRGKMNLQANHCTSWVSFPKVWSIYWAGFKRHIDEHFWVMCLFSYIVKNYN